MSRQESAVYRPFPVTQWSLIARASHGDAESRRRALAELLEQYMPAIKCYLTLGKRIDADRADDLLQSFLASKILDEHLIERADKDRGKFRTFLLTALDRFIVNQYRFDRARKRSPGQLASIDDQLDVPEQEPQPGQYFDMTWARQVIDTTIQRMKQECQGCGRSELWDVFEARVLGPTLGHTDAIPYEQMISQSGFASPVQAANALVTAKRMFARTLRSVISQYEGTDADIDQEIRDLHQILAQSGTSLQTVQ